MLTKRKSRGRGISPIRMRVRGRANFDPK